jgi:hypothetical protein
MYYWQIVTWDNHGASITGPIWEFTTEEEYIPIPDLDCDGTLNWQEVDPGSTVTGSFTVENIGEPLSLLDWEIESYPDWGLWTFDPEAGLDLTPEDGLVMVDVEVIAPDEYGSEYDGEVRIINSEDANDYCIILVSLITREEPEPDLDCEGSLSWTDVDPGLTVEGSFTVSNVGDVNSSLDWEVVEWPDWGSGSSWTFTPMSGDDLTPGDGAQTVQVEVVAPDEPETEFEGEIKIVNNEDSDDYCIIPVSLTTPVNQNAVNSQIFFQFLQRFDERFSLLEQILANSNIY